MGHDSTLCRLTRNMDAERCVCVCVVRRKKRKQNTCQPDNDSQSPLCRQVRDPSENVTPKSTGRPHQRSAEPAAKKQCALLLNKPHQPAAKTSSQSGSLTRQPVQTTSKITSSVPSGTGGGAGARRIANAAATQSSSQHASKSSFTAGAARQLLQPASVPSHKPNVRATPGKSSGKTQGAEVAGRVQPGKTQVPVSKKAKNKKKKRKWPNFVAGRMQRTREVSGSAHSRATLSSQTPISSLIGSLDLPANVAHGFLGSQNTLSPSASVASSSQEQSSLNTILQMSLHEEHLCNKLAQCNDDIEKLRLAITKLREELQKCKTLRSDVSSVCFLFVLFCVNTG